MGGTYEERIIAAASRLVDAEEDDDEAAGAAALEDIMRAVRGLRARRPSSIPERALWARIEGENGDGDSGDDTDKGDK